MNDQKSDLSDPFDIAVALYVVTMLVDHFIPHIIDFIYRLNSRPGNRNRLVDLTSVDVSHELEVIDITSPKVSSDNLKVGE